MIGTSAQVVLEGVSVWKVSIPHLFAFGIFYNEPDYQGLSAVGN